MLNTMAGHAEADNGIGEPSQSFVLKSLTKMEGFKILN